MSSLGAKGGYKTEKVVIAEVNNASKEGMFWINQLGLGEFDYVCADACASGKKGDAALVISGGQGRTLVNVSIKSISSGVGGLIKLIVLGLEPIKRLLLGLRRWLICWQGGLGYNFWL